MTEATGEVPVLNEVPELTPTWRHASEELRIYRENGPRPALDAWVRGPLAVVRTLDSVGEYSLTHVPTGRSVGRSDSRAPLEAYGDRLLEEVGPEALAGEGPYHMTPEARLAVRRIRHDSPGVT